MQRFEREVIEEAAGAISRYLETRPNAVETVEGVAKWWLLRQRYEDSLDLVQRALDFLESEGAVVRVSVSGNKTVYRRASGYPLAAGDQLH